MNKKKIIEMIANCQDEIKLNVLYSFVKGLLDAGDEEQTSDERRAEADR